MLGMCLAPLILMGHMLTIETPWHQVQKKDDGQVIEAMTCDKGLGFDVKASTSGYYGFGLQYGFKHEFNENWAVSFLPKAGLSYVDHTVYELPQRAQFEVGAQALVEYKRMVMGVEYWHLSNAGMTQPNIGMDFLILQTGWRF
jgi:hypothetical protein